eukprot:CAMPEP_0202795086 /NCGR_PEP_ID=MMETSP1388-20130828/89318_1 /ASSEMBLY_ACC=CAM_ASM_000864 /TAXON_ID=37098 /ORGANISM="Isochrysis sp, Strain CCMP1244" /LENGTH=50 /DNA_ID=CAMNT_0049464951 /DNA_START=121 /DNA_END=270 /DNA_ORIENTATION=+
MGLEGIPTVLQALNHTLLVTRRTGCPNSVARHQPTTGMFGALTVLVSTVL